MSENEKVDLKSLRFLTRGKPDWNELAKDCVAFANAQGGRIVIGVEDGESEPPGKQTVESRWPGEVQRRIGELTVNVLTAVSICHSETTGGQYLEIRVSRSGSPASTSDGRYYLRVSDVCKPVVGEEVQRLMNERSAQPWETLTALEVPRERTDQRLLSSFMEKIRASDRVKDSVREKSENELLDHYYLAIEGYLTNLGILLVGRREDRARLGTAPVIQFIKYDADGRKINKIVWDDYSLSPIEMIEAVWQEIPDFRESYEMPDGFLRHSVPAFDQKVVRELLVNALVHRPYTQRGDIFLNLHPDRLEVVNPGLLPLGVTPQNILHQSVRRNNELARVFHDVGLMEREGSGFDLLYEILATQGRAVPNVREGADRVEIIIGRRIIKPEVIELMAKAEQIYDLRQREKITLGILAQHEAMTAQELVQCLELQDNDSFSHWIGRLLEWQVVLSTGRTKGTRYYVAPEVLNELKFPLPTTLVRIEPHRLEALVLEDIRRHPDSAIGDIHNRIGSEIRRRQVKTAIDRLVTKGRVVPSGEKRGRKYVSNEE